MIDQETLNTFDKLYYETYPDILKYVIVNCSNIEDVKDIIQNIYLAVLQSINENKPLINSSYIMGIAKNKVKDYYRFKYKNKIISIFSKIKDQNSIELIDSIETDINIEKSIIKNEDIKMIWKFLKKENVIIAKIFYLYYYNDYSIKEISRELNIGESNVKNYLYRTLKKLNCLMKDKGEENV